MSRRSSAVDGSVIADVEGQARNLPSDATHLVISAEEMTLWVESVCSTRP